MSVVDDVKQRLDLVACIARYVPLQKAGRNFRARCPFHQERTPSFYVFPESQSWHCFGACGTGGDLFSFYMKKEQVSFGEALRLLAEQAGIALPEPGAGEPSQESTTRARLLQALEEAAQFYQDTLLRGRDAAAARRYLGERGLTEDTERTFRLGYSPTGGDALCRALRSQGYRDSELVEAGLVLSPDGGVFDRFRGRVMFPVRDGRGRVVGFGARSLDGSPPKYLNSPQTALFDKGGLLYGLDLAREAARQEGRMVIVEGYFDALLVYQAGCRNVVAAMGTALTARQVGLLRGVAPQVVLALDADAPGAEATLRGVLALVEALERKVVPVPAPPPVTADGRQLRRWRQNVSNFIRYEPSLATEIRVALLPVGKDPADVVQESPETWHTLVAESLPVLDYALARAADGLDLSQSREVSQAADQVLPFIVEIRDPVRRGHELQRLARRLQVDVRALQLRLATIPPIGGHHSRPAQQAADREDSPVPEADAGAAPLDRWDQVEELCLALLLQHPECAAAGAELREDHFSLPERCAILAAWRTAGGFPALWDVADPALHETIAQLLSFPLPPGGTPDRAAALRQGQRRLEARRLRQAKIRQARLLQEPAATAEAVSRLSLALWQGQEPVPELEEAGEELRALAEAQRQGLQITERLRALFSTPEAPAGNP